MISNTLYRPKLEKGVRATEWSPCSVYTSSLIKQTADGIMLEVDRIVDDLSGDTQAQYAALELTVNGITQEVSDVKNTVSGHTEDIGRLKVTAQGISATVDSYIEGTARPNMVAVNGWMDKEEKFIEPTADYKYYAEKSYVISPKVYLDVETYTISHYNNQHKRIQLIDSGNNVITPTVQSATTETYKSIPRYYETYQITTAGEYKLKYGDNTTDSEFYRPKLEKGDVATPYYEGQIHYSSLIQQTSQEIKLQVQEQDAIGQFKQTGLDITNGKIELNADNTEIHGNLELFATNDSDALTLFDNTNTEKTTVTSHNIGKLSEQSQNASKSYSKRYELSFGQSTIFDFDTIHFAANTVVTAGQQYTDRISYIIFYYYDSSINRYNEINVSNGDKCSLILQFVNTTTNTTYVAPSITTYNGKGTFEAKQDTTKTVTIVEEGNYKVQCKFQWDNGTTTSPFVEALCNVTTSFTSQSSTKTLIGADGLYTTTGAENYLYNGSDGFAASYAQIIRNGNASGRSSVGAMNCAYNNDTQSPDNKYIYTGDVTGPSHIAAFKGNNQQWTNSQSYANIDVFIKSDDYSQTQYVPLPSTDIIYIFDDKYVTSIQNISLAEMEYKGHIVTIKTHNNPCKLNILPSTGGVIVGRRGGQFESYNKNLYMIRMVFMDVTSSGPNESDNYNGVWLILDEETA